jgi:hypothetical protein
MAEPPTPAPPTADRPGSMGALLKRVPTWAWVVGGGGILGIGYAMYRDRRMGVEEGPPAGEESLAELSEYDLATQPSPGGAYYPSQPIIAEPAETVGAVGQVALETLAGAFTGLIETLPGLIEAGRAPEPVVVGDMAAAPPPDSGAGFTSAPTPGPGAARPRPAPRRTPAPRPSVTILGKKFNGATRFHEIPTPGMPHGRDFNVFYPKPHQDERWRYNTQTRQWRKIASGNWGG